MPCWGCARQSKLAGIALLLLLIQLHSVEASLAERVRFSSLSVSLPSVASPRVSLRSASVGQATSTRSVTGALHSHHSLSSQLNTEPDFEDEHLADLLRHHDEL